MDAVEKLEYNGKSQKSIIQSLEASYVQVQWFDMLRSWLHLLLADEGLHALDIYLAAALLKKCGWFSTDEQKNRIATMRKLAEQNYEWAAAMVRAEIYKVEDGSRLVARGKMPSETVGMGFTATKVTPHKVRKGQGRGKKPSTAPRDSTNLNCFRCGEKGHRIPECPKKKDSLTAEEKAKGKEAQESFNKAKAERSAEDVEPRTQLGAMNEFELLYIHG